MTEKNDRPVLLVAALVLDGAGCVLLTRHEPHFKWHLPDGEVRHGETLKEALSRSLREDLDVEARMLDDEPWFVAETIRKGGIHFVTHHFRAALPKEKKAKLRPGLEAVLLDLLNGFAVRDFLPSTVAALDAASWRGLL